MGLQERVENHTINIPPWFGNSIAARLTRFYYRITGRLEIPAAPIPEDAAFADAFAVLPRRDRNFIVGWLRDNYCRIAGLDYKPIKL